MGVEHGQRVKEIKDQIFQTKYPNVDICAQGHWPARDPRQEAELGGTLAPFEGDWHEGAFAKVPGGCCVPI